MEDNVEDETVGSRVRSLAIRMSYVLVIPATNNARIQDLSQPSGVVTDSLATEQLNTCIAKCVQIIRFPCV